MRAKSKILSILMSLVLVVGLCPTPAFANEVVLTTASTTLTTQATMSQSDYNAKSSAFVNDARWRDGVYFGNDQGPKLSTYGSGGCFAYACDFTMYMYGVNSISYGASFSNRNDIRQGDVIQINGGGHTIVVLGRNGDSLYTAEGNYGYTEHRVRVANGAYTVSGLNFYTGWHYVDIATGSSFQSYVDDIHGVAGGIYLKGWTFNKNNLTRSTQVHVYLDGPLGSSNTSWAVEANVARTDVDAAYHVGAYHGFETTITGIPAGKHTVYLYANDQYLNQFADIGSYTVSVSGVDHNPKISFDSVSSTPGKVRVVGWAYDPDAVTKSSDVHVYVSQNGGPLTCLGGTTANVSRKDVDNSLHIGEFHGFDATFDTSLRGLVDVQVVGINVGEGSHVWSGKKTVNVTSSANIAGAAITGLSSKTYTGSKITQNPTVTYGSAVLSAGSDYTLSYANNVNAGTATMTITGRGSYTGSKSATFSIEPAAITSVSVSPTSFAYDGTAKTPSLSVRAGSLTVPASGYTASYSNNVNPGTASVTVAGRGNFTGSKSATFTILAAQAPSDPVVVDPTPVDPTPGAQTESLYRLHNPATGEHLYTTSASEYRTLSRKGWEGEGAQCSMPAASSSIAKAGIYRLFNPRSGEHHYTMDSNEIAVLTERQGWALEGLMCYAPTSKANKKVPMYRLNNPARAPHTHLFTTDANEYNVLGSRGWQQEGIAWYGL